MNACLVIVTHNRLDYTKKCLESVFKDNVSEFDLYIWDNASSDGTKEYLNELKDPRLKEIYFSEVNLGPTAAMNYFWKRSNTELVGKLDNDCLISPGWINILSQAHRDIERLGAVACWHFKKNDFDEKAAYKLGKIQKFNGHLIFRHPWVCGSGFIMKRKTYEKYGEWKIGVNVGTTEYFLKMALGGEINGWYYPFILQEHMDDPASEYTIIRNDEDIKKMYDVTYTLRTKNIQNMKSRWERRKFVLDELNYGPWEAKWYIGYRGKLRRLQKKAKNIFINFNFGIFR